MFRGENCCPLLKLRGASYIVLREGGARYYREVAKSRVNEMFQSIITICVCV